MAEELSCLKTVVESGSRRYPLFVGFMAAERIEAIAEAPSFTEATSHRAIAANVLEPPVKDWQRPLDPERVAAIKNAFRDSGALMPNPVLLSENGEEASRVTLKQEMASGSIPTNVWTVIVDDKGPQKPLWILDGQHRINGLAASKQKSNEIPVVLLLNDDPQQPSYTGRDFANLFAQVTTTAKKLDDLHNAWLTFAYNLDEYAVDHADHETHRRAMQTVAELCRRTELTGGDPNPFLNYVRFNPERGWSGGHGFAYGCHQLKELVRRHYFAESPSNALEPAELADEISRAIRALKEVVRAPQDESVFFGGADYGQLPMQDGFLIGVLVALRTQGRQTSWTSFLKGLAFHQTDWRFRPWVKTTGGKAGTDSKVAAQRVLGSVFSDGQLPEGVGNLADYLRGDRAGIHFEFSRPNEKGRPLKAGRQHLDLLRGDDKSRELEDHRHVRITKAWKRTNIARLEIVDASSNVANPRKVPELLGAGLLLSDDAQDRELHLAIYMHFYGGTGTDAKLTLRW